MIDFLTNSDTLQQILSEILPIVFCGLSIISSFLILLTYWKYERLRMNAGKITYLITMNELILTLFFLTSVFYDDPKTDKSWCLTVGIFTNVMIFVYFGLNFALSHNLLCCILYKENEFSRRFKKYLIFSAFLAGAVTLIEGLTAVIGYGPMGFCWLKNEYVSQIINIVVAGVVFPFTITCMIYVYAKEHHLKSHSIYYEEEIFTKTLRSTFVKVNLAYILVFTVTWLPNSVIYIIEFVSSLVEYDLKQSTFWEIIKSVAFNCLCCSPFLMFMVRASEPLIKKALKRIILCKGRQMTSGGSYNNENQLKLDDPLITINNDMEESPPLMAESVEEKRLTLSKKSSKGSERSLPRNSLTSANTTGVLNFNLNWVSGREARNFRAGLEKNKSANLINKMHTIKSLAGVEYLLKNDVNAEVANLQSKSPPWDLHFYQDFTMLNNKLSDIVKNLVPEDQNVLEHNLKDALYDMVHAVSYASLVFTQLKQWYRIDNKDLIEAVNIANNLGILGLQVNDPLAAELGVITCERNTVIFQVIGNETKNHVVEKFLQNYHSHVNRCNVSTFLVPILGLYTIQVNDRRIINFLMLENNMGKSASNELSTVIIYDGVYVERYVFKDGENVHKEKLSAKSYQVENALKLKLRDKNLLISQLKRDLKFLVKNEAVKYKIQFTFRRVQKKIGVFLQKTTSLQVQEEPNNQTTLETRDMRFSVASSAETSSPRYLPNRFETFLEDFICHVSIHQYCQFSRENEIEDISQGKNQVFSINNPESYGKGLLESIQEAI